MHVVCSCSLVNACNRSVSSPGSDLRTIGPSDYRAATNVSYWHSVYNFTSNPCTQDMLQLVCLSCLVTTVCAVPGQFTRRLETVLGSGLLVVFRDRVRVSHGCGVVGMCNTVKLWLEPWLLSVQVNQNPGLTDQRAASVDTAYAKLDLLFELHL